jgi:hypothetical protein
MITAHHRKQPACVGKRAFFDVFNPSSINADRNFVFRFASHCAGVTADTFAVINDKAVIHIAARLTQTPEKTQ